MSSVFKISCSIFWLTWILCFTYMLSTHKFVDDHIMQDEQMAEHLLLLNIISYITTAFAFIGWAFMKCDITNVCCALLFGIPTGLVLPGAAFYGAYKVSKVKQSDPTAGQAFALVAAEFKKSGHVPHWLTQSEDEFHCCGINGPVDYRNIYRSLGEKTCLKHTDDIPCTCCAEFGRPTPEVFYGSTNCHKGMDNSACQHQGSVKWMEELIYKKGSNKQKIQLSLAEKCKPSKTPLFVKTFDKTKRSSTLQPQVFEKGCYERLKVYYDMMNICMLVFFIIFAVCSLLMAIAFLKNFCKSAVITGEPSDYSLDVENVSLMATALENRRSMIGRTSNEQKETSTDKK